MNECILLEGGSEAECSLHAEKERVLTDGSSESMENFLADKVVYVDKTGPICQLAKGRGSYLLTRPRRMGKTTMVSTLEHLFTKGTQSIASHKRLDWSNVWSDPNSYFVFHFDFSDYDVANAKEFCQFLLDDMQEYADYFGIELPKNRRISKVFKCLMEHSLVKLKDQGFLSEHPELTNRVNPISTQEVVLLIDEYDVPLTQWLHKSEVFDEIRSVYRQIFAIIKRLVFRFVFVTGVCSYAQTSIFSGANQFIDLSLEEEYATCCGFTREEIERYFAPELERAEHDVVGRFILVQ